VGHPQLAWTRAELQKIETPDEDAIDPKPVITFLVEHMHVARGAQADWGDLYGGFRE